MLVRLEKTVDVDRTASRRSSNYHDGIAPNKRYVPHETHPTNASSDETSLILEGDELSRPFLRETCGNFASRVASLAEVERRESIRLVLGDGKLARNRGESARAMASHVCGSARKAVEDLVKGFVKCTKVSEGDFGRLGDGTTAPSSEPTTSSSTGFHVVGAESELQAKEEAVLVVEVMQELEDVKRGDSGFRSPGEDASDTSGEPLPVQLKHVLPSILSTSPIDATKLRPFKFGVSHSRGARPYMEDRYNIVATFRASGQGEKDDGTIRSFCGVYDGHNGFKAAEYASSRIQQLMSYHPCLMHADPHPVDVKHALRASFLQTDREILDRMKKEGCRDGTTAVVAMRLGGYLYLGNVGDSRAVLCRKGVAYRLTIDHKPDLAHEKSRVHSVGGRVEFSGCWRVICEPRENRPGSGLAVTRSLGDLDFKEPIPLVEANPDVGHLPMQPDDQFVILGSDGLWDVITDQEAADLVYNTIFEVRKHGQVSKPRNTRSGMAKAASDALVRAALKRGSLDNVTSLVILFEWC